MLTDADLERFLTNPLDLTPALRDSVTAADMKTYLQQTFRAFLEERFGGVDTLPVFGETVFALRPDDGQGEAVTITLSSPSACSVFEAWNPLPTHNRAVVDGSAVIAFSPLSWRLSVEGWGSPVDMYVTMEELGD